MHVAPSDVQAFIGKDGENEAALQAHIDAATLMIKAYTRGGGFDTTGDPVQDVAAVIVSCAARLHKNPSQLRRSMAIDDYSETIGTFNGWTLPERAVLHQYRRRAL